MGSFSLSCWLSFQPACHKTDRTKLQPQVYFHLNSPFLVCNSQPGTVKAPETEQRAAFRKACETLMFDDLGSGGSSSAFSDDLRTGYMCFLSPLLPLIKIDGHLPTAVVGTKKRTQK